MEINDHDLIEKARSLLNPRKLSTYEAEAGGVGSVLVTDKGNLYSGVCVEACSIVICAEQVAVSAMITNGESHVTKIVAVDWDGKVLAPCGSCREFIYRMNDENKNADVILPGDLVMKLADLLPMHPKH